MTEEDKLALVLYSPFSEEYGNFLQILQKLTTVETEPNKISTFLKEN